jgi:WhiB family transcriptional regulator, redox-sensing transcriptional regulator
VRESGAPGRGSVPTVVGGKAENKGGRIHMGMITDWPSLAACRDEDPDALFVQGAEQNVAKRICRGCPVRYECLADALDNRIEFGVWGGMTERERRALLRRHPHVLSWRRTFEAAMRDEDLVSV